MNKKHNILAVITARGGSKGIPNKNIKELGGKPLICYSIKSAKKSKLLTHTIVSTDDEKIADVARRCGGDVPFMRPKQLAQDKTPHLPVMQHAVKFMEEKEGIIFDFVVILQPTSPFRTGEDIDGTIQKIIDTGADSAVSVSEIDSAFHPYKMKKLEGDMLLPLSKDFVEPQGMRRQDQPVFYKRNSMVYVMKRDTYMVKDQLYGDSTAGFVMDFERCVDIDNQDDWANAEVMLKNLKKKGHNF